MRCAVQEAPWLELLALVELCAQCKATGEDREALARLVESLPEAEDSDLAWRARSLLPARDLACN